MKTTEIITEACPAGTPAFAYIPPDENALRGQIERIIEQGEKAPRRRPGDRFTLFGAILGIIIGIVAGIFSRNFILILLYAVGGGILGAVIGSFIGRYVVKRRRSKRQNISKL